MPTRSALLVLAAVIAGGCAGAAGPVGQTQNPATTEVTDARPSGSTCNLVMAAEMSSIWGVQMAAVPDTDNGCTWAASTGLPSMDMRWDPTDLVTARSLLGNDADVNVAGSSGVIGNLLGVALYVNRGSFDLVIQTVLLEDTPENRQKVVATAEHALSRVP